MRIPLVIAFTHNYFVPAAVTLHSIMTATNDNETCYEVLCLVTEDIPQDQKEKLQKMCEGRMSFKYINLKGRLDGLYVDPKYSEAASYRLLLPELLPELDKVVYIDCDVVVRQDLASLYSDTDLGDSLLAAVYEAPVENQAERWEALGCNARQYFNSGFLVMNLARMREEGTSAKLLDVLKADYLEFPDQDALNIVCQGRVKALSPVYNGIRTFFLPVYKQDFVKQYSEDLWEKVQEEATIHYTGGKPWNIFSVKFGEWWNEYRSLPSYIGEEWTPSFKIKTLAALYGIKPFRAVMDGLRNFKQKCTRT